MAIVATLDQVEWHTSEGDAGPSRHIGIILDQKLALNLSGKPWSVPYCPAERVQARPQLRLFAPQQQTLDRIAAVSAGLRPESGIGFSQKTPATHMPLLRRRDEHRANADTACIPGSGQMKRRVH